MSSFLFPLSKPLNDNITALAECLSPEDAANGQVFPHISNIRMVSRKVAVAVIEEAIESGIATKISTDDREDIDAYVASKMYYPVSRFC